MVVFQTIDDQPATNQKAAGIKPAANQLPAISQPATNQTTNNSQPGNYKIQSGAPQLGFR